MTRLVILGLLLHKERYGYEIKSRIEKYMGDWTNIAFGSIYFALSRLTKEGLLQQIGEERSGSRPSRKIYAITDRGREEFLRLLRAVWEKPERQFYSMDVAVFFDEGLEREKRLECLDRQIEQMRVSLAGLHRHQEEVFKNPHVPEKAGLIFDHSRRHMEAELSWLEDLRKWYDG